MAVMSKVNQALGLTKKKAWFIAHGGGGVVAFCFKDGADTNNELPDTLYINHRTVTTEELIESAREHLRGFTCVE